LRLSYVQNTSEGFFQDLIENRIDCAFPALESKSNELISDKLCRLEVGLVLPPGHRLAGRSEIHLEQLRNERWILPPREANPVLYDELISCCHKTGFTPDVVAEMTQRPRVVAQVACGIGVATLVKTMAHLCIGGTTFHRLIRPTPMLECYLVYRKNPSSPFVKRFILICLELAKNFSQGNDKVANGT
jgi:DNA-binding transcriptional LysR family regulator